MPAYKPIRGIHATLYARITREVDFQSIFERRYANEPFVDVLPPGSHPETRSVRAANTCRIAVHRPQGGDTLVILSVSDNLVKGAAGQDSQHEPHVRAGRMRRSFADPRLALILRRLRGRFGASAPRVAVRTHLPWYWRALAIVLLLATAIALSGWVYDAGRRFAGFDRSETEREIQTLRDQVAQLDGEVAKLRTLANASESNLQIERTAQQQLTRQVKTLEDENTRLPEEVAGQGDTD